MFDALFVVMMLLVILILSAVSFARRIIRGACLALSKVFRLIIRSGSGE